MTESRGNAPLKSTVPASFAPPDTITGRYGCEGSDTTVGRGGTLPSRAAAGCAASAFLSVEQPQRAAARSSAAEIRLLIPISSSWIRLGRGNARAIDPYTSSLPQFVNLPPAEPGGHHARLQNLVGRNRHDVPVEYHAVSVLSGRDRSHHLLLKTRVGRPDGHGLQRFGPCHDLRRIPSARWPVARILSRHRRVEGDERIHFLDRKITAVRDDHSRLQQ